MDWDLVQAAFMILVGYIALDVATHLTKQTFEDTGRRVFAVSTVFAISAYFLSILYAEVLSVFPQFDGLPLTAVQLVSLIIALYGGWVLYHKALEHSKLNLIAKVDVLEECARLLDESLKPLQSAIGAAQASVFELSSKMGKLGEVTGKLVNMVEVQGRDADEWTQALVSIIQQDELRESEFKKAMDQYSKWNEERVDVAKTIEEMIKGAERVLEEFAVFLDLVDEYSDSLGVGEHEGELAGGVDVQGQKGGQGAQTSPVEGRSPALIARGKLTREAGRANRDKGNRAQLQFAETILRPAGKKFECILKEGQPDFVFHGPSDNVVKAIGAFKALSLSEAGTKQRWIPRRKLLAELRTATKYGVPLILFVLNLANGRIWAKVLSVGELREFDGITTPLMLVENDPASEKICRETLEMALQLL